MTKQEALDKLKEISEYKENWNGYGAEPFGQDLIDMCRKMINRMLVTPFVYPAANNSIQFEYQGVDETYIEIEVFDDKCCLFVNAGKICAHFEFRAMFRTSAMFQTIDWWNVLTAIAEKNDKSDVLLKKEKIDE